MSLTAKLGRLNERARDLAWAVLAAALLCVMGFLDPINQVIWAAQSTFNQEKFSGDIAFATSRDSLTDPAKPEQRLLLAARLRELAKTDVEEIYINAVFDRASSPQADRELADAVSELGDRISFVWRITSNVSGQPYRYASIPEVAGDARQVASYQYISFTGYSWEVPTQIEYNGQPYATLPSVLAKRELNDRRSTPISYSFDIASLPLLNLDRPIKSDSGKFSDMAIVIGNPIATDGSAVRIPGSYGSPPSYSTIYAAETIKAGHLGELSEWAVLAGYVLAMFLTFGLFKPRGIIRSKLYSVIGISIPAALILATYFHFRVGFAAPALFVAWYAALRLRVRWQKRFALEDDKTGLPTFRALEKRISEDGNPSAIIVAKVHGYEDVVKTLPAHLHAAYIRSLVERFRVADAELAIYANEGRYFAWVSSAQHQPTLEAHLDGLRALFSAPIVAGGVEIDAGITFGIDMSAEPDATQRIASAVSAAELTDEAHQPIVFARLDEESDALWKLSLQARIDNALENREIYLVYQPKVDIETGEMVGCEALVRWNDPARGEISPAYFIQECERAGRMGHLTEYVLEEALGAAAEMVKRGIKAKMSVNISATLLRGDAVEVMVKDALAASGLEPCHLMLEVTETARIVDIEQAICVLDRIRAFGVGISIDDFGVGAANLEAIYRLPFDELKIDRIFVSSLNDPKAAGIVGSMIEFGKKLRITIVAEGAEDDETIGNLGKLGCRIVQGYGISRPLEFPDLLKFQSLRASEQLRNVV